MDTLIEFAERGEALPKRAIDKAFSERFARPDEHQRKLRRELQAARLMATAPGRGRSAPRDNQTGLAAYAIASVQDAPLAESAALTLQTLEAPLTPGQQLYLPKAGGDWANGRSIGEIMEEGCKSEDVPFSETFSQMLGFGPVKSVSDFGDAFGLAIWAASLGRFDLGFPDFDLTLDIYVFWRRPAAFLRLRRKDRPSDLREIWAHYGDTEHRPGQNLCRIDTGDIRFLGNLLARGA